VIQKEWDTFTNLLLSNWFPLAVEMRTIFKRQSLGKIKGISTIRCTLVV